jgi:hypothetical protein
MVGQSEVDEWRAVYPKMERRSTFESFSIFVIKCRPTFTTPHKEDST